MHIRTSQHGLSSREAFDLFYSEQPHAYTRIVFVGLRNGVFRRQVFRCPGYKPVDWFSYESTEHRLLREVQEINRKMDVLMDGGIRS